MTLPKDGRVPASLIMQPQPAKGSAAGSRAVLTLPTGGPVGHAYR